MLVADRLAVDSELKAQAIQIKNIEMQNIDRYLGTVGTQAALIAGFSIAVLMGDELIRISNGDNIHMVSQALLYSFAMLTLCFQFYCVLCSTLVSVLGPTYALNGPKGSMHSAVRAMKEERTTILYSFGSGVGCFGCTMICTSWVTIRPLGASMCTLIVLSCFTVVLCSAKRILGKFRFVDEMHNQMNYEKQLHINANDFLKGQTKQDQINDLDSAKYTDNDNDI